MIFHALDNVHRFIITDQNHHTVTAIFQRFDDQLFCRFYTPGLFDLPDLRTAMNVGNID